MDTIKANQYISYNQKLISKNKKYEAIFQTDGNFCIYPYGSQRTHEHCKWSTNTYNKNAKYLKMQDDGNLVIYNKNNNPIWSSDTYYDVLYPQTSRLIMQDDGNLVIYTNNGPLW
ncbi:mannose-specific lectin precursor, partial [Lichtheimia hyalospora FSU 10163]